MGKKTSLYEEHVKAGAIFCDFASYELPMRYKDGIIAEHMAVRESSGIFDVSHMGEIEVSGPDSPDFLEYALSNTFLDLKPGRARYSLILNELGGVKDDVIVYKFSPESFMLVPNASNKDKIFFHLRKLSDEFQALKTNKANGGSKLTLKDLSERISQIAVQGPASIEIVEKFLSSPEAAPKKYYSFAADLDFSGMKILLSRSGYTGETGYEIYAKNEDAPEIWRLLLSAGARPCGLGARDTLRLESGMPLYGHELSEEIHASGTGLLKFVRTDKTAFIGKSAVIKDCSDKIRVGIRVTGRGIAREKMKIFSASGSGEEIGFVSSGTKLPFLGFAGAMGYIKKEYSEPGTKVLISAGRKTLEAEICRLPFYKTGSGKKHTD